METTAPRINVLDPEFYVDPWEAYRWLRNEAPAYWDPAQKLWAISRYEDIVAVEKDGDRYSSFYGSRPHIDQRADRSMINMDEPAHQGAAEPRRTPVHSCRAQPRRPRPPVVTEILDAIAARRSRGDRSDRVTIAGDRRSRPARLPTQALGAVRFWSEQLMLLSGQTSPEGPPYVSRTPASAPWCRSSSQ
jgi:cytochrome P450 family 142 subfamily A polypeptide 1